MLTMDRNATITVFGMPLDYVAPMFTPPAVPLEAMSIDDLTFLYAEADDKVANGTATDDDEALLVRINDIMARRKRYRDVLAELRTMYARIERPWYRDDPFND